MQVTGADFNVSARGDNQLFANKILVMVDGRSIYIDGQGLVFWKSLPVTLPEIKRIEVLKGPASVVYGFNAFDGVINIITKSAQEMKGTTLQFGGGELGRFPAPRSKRAQRGSSIIVSPSATTRTSNGATMMRWRSGRVSSMSRHNTKRHVTSRGINRFDGPVSVQIPHATRAIRTFIINTGISLFVAGGKATIFPSSATQRCRRSLMPSAAPMYGYNLQDIRPTNMKRDTRVGG